MKARSARVVQSESPVGEIDGDSQYEQRRKAILKEAGKILERGDSVGISMTALAVRLDLTTPALYYYFKNKQEMLYECYKISLDLAQESLSSALVDGRNAGEVLELFLYRYLLAGFVDVRPMMTIRDRVSLTAQYNRKLVKQRETLHAELRLVVSRGIRDGSIEPCNPKLLVSSITGVAAIVIRAYVPQGEMTKEQVARQTVQLFVKGWSAQKKRKTGLA